jgi:hypothetical protein
MDRRNFLRNLALPATITAAGLLVPSLRLRSYFFTRDWRSRDRTPVTATFKMLPDGSWEFVSAQGARLSEHGKLVPPWGWDRQEWRLDDYAFYRSQNLGGERRDEVQLIYVPQNEVHHYSVVPASKYHYVNGRLHVAPFGSGAKFPSRGPNRKSWGSEVFAEDNPVALWLSGANDLEEEKKWVEEVISI